MEDKRDNRESTAEGSGAPYSDAYYREAPQGRGAYGYSPAQCYARVSQEESAASGKKHKNHGPAIITAACLICILLAAVLGSGGMFLLFRADPADEEDAESTREIYGVLADSAAEGGGLVLRRSAPGEREELTAEEISDLARACTVGVRVPGGDAAEGTGAGIVLSEDGYILTSYRVVEAAYENGTPIRVSTVDGREGEAEIVEVEADSDLAVLRTGLGGLVPAEMGDSSALRAGQTVYTVDGPREDRTLAVTRGVVSASDRPVTAEEVFPIDGAKASAGGPVFDPYGQVVGVVPANGVPAETGGQGFAVPINRACRIACDLVEQGYVSGKAYLGLLLAEVTPGTARYYDMVQGVYVYAVQAGSCAEAAGLLPGDIITALGDTEITSCQQLVLQIRRYRGGDSEEMTVWRDQEILTVTVVFDEAAPRETGTEAGSDAAGEAAIAVDRER